MDKKSILIGALAASLLFVSIGATYPEQEPKGVWEMHFGSDGVSTLNKCHLLNTVTGEVRSDYRHNHFGKDHQGFTYRVAKGYVEK